MFERFTDRARRVVVLAQEEARLLKHNYIGTEHLLLGLMREEQGLAAQILATQGLGLDVVQQKVSATVGPGESAPSGHIPFTRRAKKVMELALREALLLSHDYIGTEHILLGLIAEGNGVAISVLTDLGVDPDQVRSDVIRALPEVRSAIDNVGLARARRSGSLPVTQLAQLRSRVDELDARLTAIEAEAGRLRGLLREHGIEPGDPGSAGESAS
jgi:ATP-dependent Clp protease ATP-binding subunit ClpC